MIVSLIGKSNRLQQQVITKTLQYHQQAYIIYA